MSSSSTYVGAGTTLSSTYYMRNFYSKNANARISSTRSALSEKDLSAADGLALRRAIRSLGSFTYDDTSDSNIRNGVLAYISTYNNALSSAADTGDHSLERYAKQMKSITKEYADELDDIGITVNDDGTLTSRSTLFKSADLSNFKSLFSRDSKFMQRTTAVAKRIQQRSESLSLSEKRKEIEEAASKKSDSTDSSTSTVADLVSESLGLNTASLTGIGTSVDISL